MPLKQRLSIYEYWRSPAMLVAHAVAISHYSASRHHVWGRGWLSVRALRSTPRTLTKLRLPIFQT